MSYTVVKIVQVIIALGLLNVWLVRPRKSTAYRGGDAKNIFEEFAVYGLPRWFCIAVGALKIGAACALILGLFYPSLVLPAALLLSALMLGAVLMHAKVGDPLRKTVPAAIMLGLNLVVSGSFLLA